VVREGDWREGGRAGRREGGKKKEGKKARSRLRQEKRCDACIGAGLRGEAWLGSRQRCQAGLGAGGRGREDGLEMAGRDVRQKLGCWKKDFTCIGVGIKRFGWIRGRGRGQAWRGGNRRGQKLGSGERDCAGIGVGFRGEAGLGIGLEMKRTGLEWRDEM
jgi:hypothetical protein